MSTTVLPSTGRPTRKRHHSAIGTGHTNWPVTILLIIGSLTILIPLFVTINMAFKTSGQAVDGQAFSLPAPFSTSGFAEAWTLTNFPRAFGISVFITTFSVLGQIILSALAAYAIVRNWDKRLFRYSFFYLLAAMFVPFPVVALPQVRLTGIVHLDNPLGVVLLSISFGMAFNTMLLTAFLRSIPLELEESMRIDGATTWQVFWKLIMPLLGPMAATVGIFAFLGSWNDYMMPSMIIADPTLTTIPVVQQIFQTQFSNNYNVSFASYLMAMAPAIIVYIFAQKWVISGLTQGAVKS